MDRYAFEQLNVPSTLLMENAAKAVASAAQRVAKNKKAAIFCGSGNKEETNRRGKAADVRGV
jgi:NAD(P)H-hydrate repair Nnr-like enzyme with NAD(P)H-hydrate epimerase domain